MKLRNCENRKEEREPEERVAEDVRCIISKELEKL